MHDIRGIRLALRYYAKFHGMFDDLKPLTQAMYGLLNEAIRESGLNEMELRVLAHRYASPYDPEKPVEGCAEYLGVSERTVERHSDGILTKVHDYMEENGVDYYAKRYIRL